MPVSIETVARHAGVSKATVSHVVNGTRFVSEVTAGRVKATIAELGYVPSNLARSLKTQRTTTIAVVISDISNPFFTSVVRGIEDRLNDQNYQLLLCNTDEDPEKEDRYLHTTFARRVDGLIIAPVGHTSGSLQRISQHTPTVFLDRHSSSSDTPVIGVDNEEAAYSAVKHLVDHGHRLIAAITGRPQVSTSRDRRAGYERALREAGLGIGPELIRVGYSKVDGGKTAALELLGLAQPPTAMFASNNLMTLGVIKALTTVGLRCPEDVCLIGFDDHEWASEFTPPLTAVRQPTYELGRTAASVLLRLVERRAVGHIEPLRAELVVRNSCGCKSS